MTPDGVTILAAGLWCLGLLAVAVVFLCDRRGRG